MKQYNEYVKAGKDTEFNKNILPRELTKAPYYAIEVSPAVHHTMGGVKIDENARVINTKGEIKKDFMELEKSLVISMVLIV